MKRVYFMYGDGISKFRVDKNRTIRSSSTVRGYKVYLFNFCFHPCGKDAINSSCLSFAVCPYFGGCGKLLFPPRCAVDGTKHGESHAIIRATFVRR